MKRFLLAALMASIILSIFTVSVFAEKGLIFPKSYKNAKGAYVDEDYGFSFVPPKKFELNNGPMYLLNEEAENSLLSSFWYPIYEDDLNPSVSVFYSSVVPFDPETACKKEILTAMQIALAQKFPSLKIHSKKMSCYDDGIKITLVYTGSKLFDEGLIRLKAATTLYLLPNGDAYEFEYASLPSDFKKFLKQYYASEKTFSVEEVSFDEYG
ncbi:MAG: hypothetical protein AB1608_07145 [Thermoproteota archaeon]